jgi:competence protein ComEC
MRASNSTRHRYAVLYSLLAIWALSGLVRAQGPVGDPTKAPTGLTVVVLDVGQGDATIIVGPTGTALVVDGGPENSGKNVIIPMLNKLGVKTVHFVLTTHYHADHVGGLDELIDNFTVLSVWDRGLVDAPTTASYKGYSRAAGSKRNTVVVGSSFVLGGGAKATVLASNGKVGSKTYSLKGTQQIENSRSIVLRLEYGDFSMWLGGDLLGGANGTFDLESKVAPVCGDVDVYRVNHHGSNTSSNSTLLGWLKPEVSMASSGARNPYGHPTTSVTNRINPKSSSSLFMSTSVGAASNLGYAVDGTITLTTDGYRYRITGESGRSFDIYTDEVAATPVPAGTLRISELHRNPRNSEGEYLEIYCQGPGPVNLRGLVVSGNLGSFTLRTPYRLLPGEYLLFDMQGDRARNGGLPLAHCLPYGAITFGNSFDTLTLTLNGIEQDRLSFNSLPGGYGVASERVRLNTATNTFNFAAATTSYGTGDKGTPGVRNSADKTAYAPIAAMEVLPASAPGGRAIHMIATATAHALKQHAMVMSLGTSPGMTIGSTHIPLNPDALFNASLMLPGVIGQIPSSGRRGLRISVPTVAGLQGLRAYYGHVILDATGPVPFPAASNAAFFVFP